ncbi:response regulator SirA [bacterium]|nr:response regulator SirA [bacterium]
MQNRITKILKRNGRVVNFDRQRITNAIFQAARQLEGEDLNRAEFLSDKVVERLNQLYSEVFPPSVEEIQDIVIAILREEGHSSTAEIYEHYREEQARKREKKAVRVITDDNIPYKILWEEYVWNVEHSCDTVEKINQLIRGNRFCWLVEEVEKLYSKRVAEAVNRILADPGKIRIIIVAGPSSSGKTTTTLRISKKLLEKGIRFKKIELDNYYKDLSDQPRDEFGDYDFETPEALDLELVNRHFDELLNGKTVQVPIFDFQKGVRKKQTVPFTLNPNEMLLLDSLHGLYDQLTANIDKGLKFKLYIETLNQIKDVNNNFIRWSDLRMLRRSIRDSWSRNYNPFETVGHWHYVRHSEMRHIVPFIGTVDYIFNGSLQYELPVLKKYLWKYYGDIAEHYKKTPRRFDAFIRAQRVHDLLDSIEAIEDDGCIPSDSLMREYIGGSSLEY